MSNPLKLRRPTVGLEMYWPEALILLVAWAIPTGVLLFKGFGMPLARSGSLMVFFSALAEFKLLNRANRKHLLNAARLRAGQEPLEFSSTATVIGWIALVSALLGTILWGYGDLLAT
jgi:hypothetical protein